MKAYIDLHGVLRLVPENSTEEFALHHWFGIAMVKELRDEEGMPYLRHERIAFDWLPREGAAA